MSDRTGSVKGEAPSGRGPVRYGPGAALRKLALGLFILIPGGAAAETVVAALGDSLTAGYGLPEGEGFVPTMQAWLDDAGADVRLINAGVSGDTTAGGLSRAEWTLTDEVDALIVELGGNDMLRGLDPSVTRENISGILDAARAADVDVLLVGLSAPGNYGADYKAEFDAIWPDLSADYGTLVYPDFFAAISDGDRAGAAARWMQSDGIHPNAEGVERIVDAIGPVVLDLLEQ